MVLAEVSCHTSTEPLAAKLARLTVVGVFPLSTLFTATIVRAPSEARSAAKAARTSGSGTAAETLVSPKAAFAPS